MSNKLDIQERILAYLAETGLSDREIARQVGVSHSIFGTLRKGSVMGVDKVEKILGAFPKLNRRWVMDGLGPMTSDETKWSRAAFYEVMKEINPSSVSPGGERPDPEQLAKLVEKAIALVNHLEDENAEMRAELVSLLKGR